MSEAADSGFRPGAAEPGAERAVPAADQARVGPAPPGTLHHPMYEVVT